MNLETKAWVAFVAAGAFFAAAGYYNGGTPVALSVVGAWLLAVATVFVVKQVPL